MLENIDETVDFSNSKGVYVVKAVSSDIAAFLEQIIQRIHASLGDLVYMLSTQCM